MAARRYEIERDGSGQWRWRFKAGNGEIVSSGESYRNRTDCVHAVDLMRRSGDAPLVEVSPHVGPRPGNGLFGSMAPNALRTHSANAFGEQVPSALVAALRNLPR